MTAVQYPAFQTLPSVVVKTVLVQLKDLHFTDTRMLKSSYSADIQYKHLMQTCTLWRQMTLAHLYRSIEYNTSSIYKCLTYVVNGDTHINKGLDLYYARYIHTVHIYINIYCLRQAFVLFNLNKIAYLAPHISANKVYITLEDNKTDTEVGIDHYTSLQQLAIEIQMITSSATHVDIYVKTVTKYLSHYLEFAELLFKGKLITSLTLHADEEPSFATPKPQITGLTNFTCNWNNSYKSVVQIIHANATSLCFLDIRYYHYNELETIFSDDNSNPIVYPNLKYFTMEDQFNQELIPVNPASIANPFPVLERLTINMNYPFTDDIVFRGNYDTLLNMDIAASNNLESVLSMENTLLKRKLKNLRNISIYCRPVNFNVASDNNSIYASIFEKASLLERLLIEDLNISMALIWKLQNGTKYKNVKSLHCTEQYMTLTDIVHIMQGMPSLQTLKCHVSEFGDIFNGMNTNQIHQLVTTEYAMLGKNISFYSILNTRVISDNTVIVCAIFIACMCPRLYIIRLNADKGVLEYMHKRFIASKLYKMCNFKVRAVVPKYARYCWVIDR